MVGGCKCGQIETAEIKRDVDMEKAEAILSQYDPNSSNLISVLQELQEAYNYLPEQILKRISEVTGIKEAKIYGVVTFYSQFRLKPIGQNLIMLCQGTACHVNGASRIEDAIKDYLGISEGDITPDGQFTYVNVACLGCCSLAPVMMINDQTFGKLTPDKVASILETMRQEVKAV